jgi:hypothetical protein
MSSSGLRSLRKSCLDLVGAIVVLRQNLEIFTTCCGIFRSKQTDIQAAEQLRGMPCRLDASLY